MEPRTGRGPVEPPSQLLRLAESRAVFEFGALVAAAPWLRLVGRGDRHPVLVLPGFTASDRSTVALRSVLASQGYWAHGWGLGQNIGPTDDVLDGIQSRLEALHERHGRPVSVVGWSLGGIYARELARQNPDRVRLVVTLGSPFRMTTDDRSAASALFDALRPRYSHRFLDLVQREQDKPPLPVPSTAIYSRTDGVVRWHTCIDEVEGEHENIEVRSSHSGLGWNPAAVFAISDRLAQPEGRWKPFKAPLPLRPWYPPAASWLDAA